MKKLIEDSRKLIFDYSKRGKRAYSLPPDYLPQITLDDIEATGLLRTTRPGLPEVSEVELVRHYTRLSKMNYGVDDGFYPLGSCTMKYNPKVNEDIASMDGFLELHPYQDEEDIQGILQILYELERYLSNIFGFSEFSLQPCAGAQGEYVGLVIMKEYHKSKNNVHKNIVLVADSAHGTNPASVTGVGWKIKTVKSLNGLVDMEDLKSKISDDVAGLMLTNPNTLGVFERDIIKITDLVHSVDGLVYWDGANANAVMGYLKPVDAGFDIAHINLHKTFSTPHGGGGPGAGPVGVISKLTGFLPVPRTIFENGRYSIVNNVPTSIGKVHAFYGNVNVMIRAYSYIRFMGSRGLKAATENAVVLANYMKHRLSEYYEIATEGICKHEFVISLKREKKEYGVRALDVAKRLIDYGYHPPTIYFPLIVTEAIMIEPTETETIESVDAFIDAMIKIKEEMRNNPQLIINAPQNTIVGRLDEVKAVKEPELRYRA
ncbi:MAG: glycine dehydrogenase subunit 2 [bacterium]|nr:glycine dehydrogenase subunit 2 [bacterium]